MRHLVLLVAAGSSASGAPTPPPAAPAPAAAGTVVGVHVLASIDGEPATDRPVYARADHHVTLYAALDVDDHGHRRTYTDAPAPRIAGHAVHARPLAEAPPVRLAWNRIEPAAAEYSNTEGGTFHFATIEYRATAIPSAADRGSLPVDVRPTLTADHGHGVGTMRFQVVVTQGDHTVASPGVEARRGRGSGGLADSVARVSLRRDDSYLGFLTEMYGQPYVWASAGLTDATHQSERLEGSDCADFVVYGARRMGKHLAYTWTGGLPGVTRLLAAGTRGDDGVYRDAHGEPLAFPHVGDLILFPRHVGVLAEDRGTPGVLDDQDLVMHSLFDSPKEQPIADSGYADKPVELRRWR